MLYLLYRVALGACHRVFSAKVGQCQHSCVGTQYWNPFAQQPARSPHCTACLQNMQVYTQMNKTLGKVFFPSKDPALQALSFWGV